MCNVIAICTSLGGNVTIGPFAGLIRRLSIFRLLRLPDETPPGLRDAWHFLVPFTAALWGAGIAGIFLWDPDPAAMSVIHDAAVATVILAGGCRLEAARHGGDIRLLTRQNADLYRRIPEDQRPRRVVSVR